MVSRSKDLEELLNKKIGEVFDRETQREQSKRAMSNQPPKVQSEYLVENVRQHGNVTPESSSIKQQEDGVLKGQTNNIGDEVSNISSFSHTPTDKNSLTNQTNFEIPTNTLKAGIISVCLIALLGVGQYYISSRKNESADTSTQKTEQTQKTSRRETLEQRYQTRFDDLMKRSSNLSMIVTQYDADLSRYDSFNTSIRQFAEELKRNPSSNSDDLLRRVQQHTYTKRLYYPETTRTVQNNLNGFNKAIQTPFAIIGDIFSGATRGRRTYNGRDIDGSFIREVWSDGRTVTVSEHIKVYRINPYRGTETEIKR
jgi:hypothetical protein